MSSLPHDNVTKTTTPISQSILHIMQLICHNCGYTMWKWQVIADLWPSWHLARATSVQNYFIIIIKVNARGSNVYKVQSHSKQSWLTEVRMDRYAPLSSAHPSIKFFPTHRLCRLVNGHPFIILVILSIQTVSVLRSLVSNMWCEHHYQPTHWQLEPLNYTLIKGNIICVYQPQVIEHFWKILSRFNTH